MGADMWKRDESVKPPTPPNETAQQPAVASPAPKRPVEAVVMDLGSSMIIKGELSASEDLTLSGRMEGRISVPDHTLTIGPHADIKAEIAGKSVIIMGAITGNITADEKVDIRATGAVIGDIVAPRLAVAEGGSLRGKVDMPRTPAARA
jgi:cytoskeletal protein CcmA (bactofilin family)